MQACCHDTETCEHTNKPVVMIRKDVNTQTDVYGWRSQNVEKIKRLRLSSRHLMMMMRW